MKKKCMLFICITFISFISIAQHVGIGTTSPANPLHIKSTSEPEMLRIEGPTPYISFFNGTTYKGYLWYDGNKMILGTSTNEAVVISANYFNTAYFTPTGRLGLGISNPAEVLDVNGNINLTGVIKVNGNSGTAGQVLTSNGTGDPQWKNTSYGNTTRFSVNLNTSPAGPSGDASITTRYNMNATDVNIGTSSITINHAGLYHFDFSLVASVGLPAAPDNYPRMDWFLIYGSEQYALINRILSPTTEFRINWTLHERGSLEIYIPAGSTLVFHHTLTNVGSYGTGGYVTCHLISD